jgi:predicted O-methyltransferase YrrM
VISRFLFRAFEYLKYLWRCIHLHGIHSPFVYSFHQEVIKSTDRYYAFDAIESIRAKLKLTQQEISLIDLGAGHAGQVKKKRKISAIVRSAPVPRKTGELLHRLVTYFQPGVILELGTSLGLGTAYLASARKKATIYTLEGDPNIAHIASLNFKKLQLDNISLMNEDFENGLKKILPELDRLDLVYFDGNHRYQPTMDYFHLCLPKTTENSLFIFDDIYWSAGMKKAWTEIKAHPRVQQTVDLYRLGLVLFRTDQEKEHFTIYH